MPALTDNGGRAAITVTGSAPLELMWLMHNSEAQHELTGSLSSQDAIRRRYGQAARALWADGQRGYTELVVLAHRSGTLLDLELGGFFEAFDNAATEDAVTPSLLSETPFERKAIDQRLRRLRSDRSMRARYRELLEDVWALAEPEWRSSGRPAVEAAVPRWSKRLDDGATFRELLGVEHLWQGRPQLDDLADAAAADGRLVLSPGWFYGKIHAVELDGTVYLGQWIQPYGDDEFRREVAQHVSSALKALADPTRLAILMRLAHEPASVTELAREFKLSQPTVSGHVQVLREANLLDEKVEGRKARLSTDEETLRRFFSGAQEELVRLIR